MASQRIVGHGIDLVDLARFGVLIDAADGAKLSRYFTASELRDAGESALRVERLAGRFAVKEAVLKALGVGWGDGIAFTDVEVLTAARGEPSVSVHRRLESLARERAVTSWLVSTSHNASFAMASVIAVQEVTAP